MTDQINMDPNKPSEEQSKSETFSESHVTVRPVVSLPKVMLTRIHPDIITSLTSKKTKENVRSKKVTFKNAKKKTPLKTFVKVLSTIKGEGRPRGRPRKILTPSPKLVATPLKKTLKNNLKTIENRHTVYKGNKNMTQTLNKFNKSNQQVLKKSIKNDQQVLKKSIKNDQQVLKKSIKNDQQILKKSIKNDQQVVKKSIRTHKPTFKKSAITFANKSKTVTKFQNSAAKTMLKSTMIQKKNKIPIPQSKKPKLIKKSIKKQTAVKINEPEPPAIKIDPKIQGSTDSSEDEFLYDELIDEFENTFNKSASLFQPVSEKTTNITVKPSKGNKPPTIVKGGIIKMNSVPADLKTIASPGQKPVNNTFNQQSSLKRSKATPINCPISPKKPSPWPISISNSPKMNKNSQKIEDSITKKSPASKTNPSNTSSRPKTTAKPQQNSSNVKLNYTSNESETRDSFVGNKPTPPMSVKSKIGPKQTAKVVPMSKTFNEEEDMSDEYTDEETLEEIDETPQPESFQHSTHGQTDKFDTITSIKPTITPVETIKDDEDPNIDLLRILTDDSEDCVPSQPAKKQYYDKEIKTPVPTSKSQAVKKNVPQKDPIVNKNEEPKERTIYDLINELSLQRPSWNLHIIPETNAFCIAQVTKGRLGLPTLKKCIELDPVDYNTKVYIHQYHIKRFDGTYDSEDTILALIDEIDSIKA